MYFKGTRKCSTRGCWCLSYQALYSFVIYAAKNFTKRGDRSVQFVVGDRLWDYVVCLRRLSVFLLFTMWSYCIRRRSAEACFRKGTKARADFDGFLHDGAGWH